MTNSQSQPSGSQLTIQAIINQKENELLKLHKNLISQYLKNKLKFPLITRNRILKYYDEQITKENIQEHYNKKLKIFLTDLLT